MNASGTAIDPMRLRKRRAKLYDLSDDIAKACEAVLTNWKPHFKQRRYSPRLIAYYVNLGAMQAADTLYRKSKICPKCNGTGQC